MSKWVTQILLVALGSVTAVALPVNVIYQYNPTYLLYPDYDPTNPNTDYYYVDQYGNITIYQAEDNEPFEFEAVVWDGASYVCPGSINLITADDNVGTVMISVVAVENPLHGWLCGAVDVKEVRLGGTGVTGIVGDFAICGDLGEYGETNVSEIAGTVILNGAVLTDMHVGTVGANGWLCSNYLLADLWINGDVEEGGSIQVLHLGDLYSVNVSGTLAGTGMFGDLG